MEELDARHVQKIGDAAQPNRLIFRFFFELREALEKLALGGKNRQTKQSASKHQLEAENANECKVVGGAYESMAASFFLFYFFGCFSACNLWRSLAIREMNS